MNEPVELNLRDLLDFIRRGLLWAVVAAAIAAALAYYWSSGIPPTYSTRATLVATHQDPGARSFGAVLLTAPALDAAAYRTAISSRAVLDPATRLLVFAEGGFSAPVGRLASAVSVSTEGTGATTIIRITARAGDPLLAVAMANSVAQAAVQWDEGRATRSLEIIIRAIEAQIVGIDAELAMPLDENTREGILRSRGDLTLQLSSARALRNAAVGRLEFLETALTPGGPIAPQPTRTAVTGALLAALLVYGFSFLRQVLDVRIRDVEALATMTKLPILAQFPRVRKGTREMPREASSYLRTALMFDLADVHPKIIVVTSATPGEGKSSVAISLAESFATQGLHTLLLDVDLRKPIIGTHYALDRTGVATLRDAMLTQHRGKPTSVRLAGRAVLDVLPLFSALPNPTELLTNHFHLLMERIAPQYDVVVIDSAPMLPVVDTLIIAPHASAILLTVNIRDANRRHIKQALSMLRRVSAPISGIVATHVSGGTQTNPMAYGDADESPSADDSAWAGRSRPVTPVPPLESEPRP